MIYENPSVKDKILLEGTSDGSSQTDIEYVEVKDGIKVHLKGHEHPYKGMPTPEAVNAINIVKKLLFFLWIPRIKDASWTALSPYILKPEFMCPSARELRRLIPNRTGILISHVIEYDSAYRFRFQDLATESSCIKLLLKPIREIWRLNSINKRRDYAGAHQKMQQVALVLTLLLFWPPFRRSWNKALLRSDFDALTLDADDKYWISLRTDYKHDA